MKTLRPLGILVTLLAFPLADPAQAAPVTIINPSFEQSTGNTINNQGWSGATSNYTLMLATDAASRGVAAGVFGGTTQAFRPFTFWDGTTLTQGGVSQVTSTAPLANYTYTLSLNIASIWNSDGTVNQYTGFDVTLSAGVNFSYNIKTDGQNNFAIIETAAGSNILSSSYSLTNGTTGNIAINQYTTLTMVVTTTSVLSAPENLRIALRAGDRHFTNGSVIYDQLALDATAVPEPSVAGALGLAGIAFGLYRVHRRARALR